MLGSESELSQQPISYQGKPIILRAHHVNYFEVTAAITRQETRFPYRDIPGAILTALFYRSQLRDYANDTFDSTQLGRGSKPTMAKDTRKRFYQRLRSLPDNTELAIGIEKDDSCKACPIGRHCTATNAKVFRKVIQTEQSEAERVEEIRRRLLRAGYIDKRDFDLQPTNLLLNDYGGNYLYGGHRPTVRRVTFQVLRTNIGSLRDAIS